MLRGPQTSRHHEDTMNATTHEDSWYEHACAALYPLALAHHRLGDAVGPHAVDVELGGSDHEVDVRRAPVPAGCLELAVVHRLAAVEGELVRGAERDVAGRVLV